MDRRVCHAFFVSYNYDFMGYMQDEFEVNAVDGPWGDFSFSGE